MHIALGYVSSLDGKIAKTDDGLVRDWASKEDGVLLTQLISHFEVVVVGRNTYEKLLPGLHEDRLYVILTHHPKEFAEDEVPGQREFIQALPTELVALLKKRGYKSILLLTGPAATTAFLQAGLVDELYLTIEPLMLGSGVDMLEPTDVPITWKLDSVARINDQGTIVAHYLADKSSLDSSKASS